MYEASKTFNYSLPEISISSKQIFVYTNFCKTIFDLKKKIADNLQLPDECLQFKDPPKKELKDIDDHFEFMLELSVPHDISILIPNGKTIKIKDGYKMKLADIFPFIEKEGYYFSEMCIKYGISLFSSSKDISREKYPFISKYSPFFELKINNKIFTLNYDKFEFTFLGYEGSDEAKILIGKALSSSKVSIKDSQGNKNIITFKITEKYQINVIKSVKFYKYDDENIYKSIDIDFLSTVSDIQRELAKGLSYISDKILPKNIKIYDSEKNKIENTKKPLSNYLDQKLYYNIIDIRLGNEVKRKYNYLLPELSDIPQQIEVNINECQTINDLKKQIASLQHISDDQLHFENIKTKELIYYEDHFSFKLTIISFILFPSGEKVKIKDCYKKNFHGIIESLIEEGYYYSPVCILKNFHLYLSDKEFPREGYPLLSIKSTIKLEIKLTGNFVELKYHKYHFFFSENETVFEAKDLIKKYFPSYNISIQDSHGKYSFKLASYEKYIVKIEANVDFIDKEKSYLIRSIPVDYFDNVSSIQQKLSKKVSIYETIKAENITIYDKDKKKIEDNNKPLSVYQNLQQVFYYSTQKQMEKDRLKDDHEPLKIEKGSEETIPSPSKKTIKIIVISLKTNENQFYPIRENIPLDSTIGDIEKMVSNKFDIKDKIILKYETEESFEPIESTKKIEEVKDLIKVTKPSGKVDYLIYYEIQSKSKAEAKEMKDKAEDETKTSPKAKIEDKKRYKFDEPSKTATDDLSSEEEDLYKKPLTINRTKEDWSPKAKDDKKEPMKAKKETPKKPTPTKTSEDEEIKNRRKPSSFKYKPKITSTTPESSPKKEDRVSTSSTYNFEFEGKKKQIKMRDDSTIEMQLPTIKKEFDIPSEEVLKFEFNGDDDDSETIKSIKFKVSMFKNGTIRISLPIKPKTKSKKKAKAKSERPSIKTPLSKSSSSSSSKAESQKFPLESSPIKMQLSIYKEEAITINQESNLEIEKLKKIIEEQKSRIEYLENIIEESEKNQENHYIEISEDRDEDTILILNYDQINSLKKIKELISNQSENICEVCQTKQIKQYFIQKILKETTHERFQSFIKEHEILRNQNHPNILKTYGIFLSDKTHPPSIIFEHWTSDLENKMKNDKLNNNELITIIYEIAEGMRYVHFRKIVHRNLNPKSIFISDDGHIKIGEFGISKLITPNEQFALSMKGLNCGIEYMSPELKEEEGEYDEKVDVYSFGRIILYILNSGQIKNAKTKQVEIPKTFTEFSTNIIEECTNENPKERPSFENICENIENNYHQMIHLTAKEKRKIKAFIEEHKKQIPNYSH